MPEQTPALTLTVNVPPGCTIQDVLRHAGIPLGLPNAEPSPGPVAEKTEAKPRRTRTKDAPVEEAPAEEAPKPMTYTVRRYGGEIDGEFADSGTASERFGELLAIAGRVEAVDALFKANADMLAELPPERMADIREAKEKVLEFLAKPIPQEKPTYIDHNKQPFTQVTLDQAGASAAMFAIASSPAPLGYNFGLKLLEKHSGGKPPSKLKPDDPQVEAIARAAAEALGLPVVAPEASAAEPHASGLL